MKHLTHEELNAFLDGELAASEMASIESHVAECAECSAELDDFRSIKNLMGSLTEVDVPRSFKLPAEFGTVAPISSPATPSTSVGSGMGNLTRFEPVARILSIAAVLAFLVLGGGQVAGLFGDDDSNTNNNTELVSDSETNTNSAALDSSEPALERGELREQGDSAATGAGSLTTNLAPVENVQQADEGLTALEITTIGIGVVALAAIASWILIHYRAGTVS